MSLHPLSWHRANGGHRLDIASAPVPLQWLTSCEVLEGSGDEFQARTGDEEGCLVVLAGCHDLFAGGGSWIERGVRNAPHEGRPVVVFLPPNTPFKMEGGKGQVLRLGSRQPAAPEPEGTAGRKPLLAMAGSGKAFDPNSGEWKPQETMPNSPEALLPRRIERSVLDAGVVRERLLPVDHKARGLVADEFTVPQSACIALDAPGGDWAEECLVIVRPAPGATAVLCTDGAEHTVTADDLGAAWAGPSTSVEVRSEDGPTWLLWAHAGPKPRS